MDEADYRARSAGIAHAWQVMFRALVATHPDPEALRKAISEEHEESMALMLADKLPDSTIEAYRDLLSTVLPDDWPVP